MGQKRGRALCLLDLRLSARNDLSATFNSSPSQDIPPRLGGHSFHEAVFVVALSVARLICSLQFFLLHALSARQRSSRPEGARCKYIILPHPLCQVASLSCHGMIGKKFRLTILIIHFKMGDTGRGFHFLSLNRLFSNDIL